MPDDTWKENGARMKAWRKAQVPEISQENAAKRIGAAQKSWSEWETGEKAPDLGHVIDLERLTEGAVPAIGWVRTRTKAEHGTKRRSRRRSAAASGS